MNIKNFDKNFVMCYLHSRGYVCMKISSVCSNGVKTVNRLKSVKNCTSPVNKSSNLNYPKQCFSNIPFWGYPVYILDGGIHADNMEHFAHAVSKDMDTTVRNVDVVPMEPTIKQLKSLEDELIKLNKEKSSFNDEYVTIPAFVSVPLLNIKDQYNAVMPDYGYFTPSNIEGNKGKLLSFLQKIYQNPGSYRRYIGYMDPVGQGIEYTYGVIREINKMIEKGAKVYIPSGHPHDQTLKWMAGERGYKPELYHFIATGEDKNGVVEQMQNEIKRNNWYDFNLLALSDANIIGIKDAGGEEDYLFASYDNCITDSARGVYNFSPVRENGKLVGYSYTDTTTNEYPYDEFPENDKVENIVGFVGKKLSDVIATQKETDELNKKISNNISVSSCADKLYRIEDVFSPEETEQKKLSLEGKYTDKTRNLYFDVNSSNEVVFPRCNCEGSQKPSVMSMWGSCFSTINAVARDIDKTKKNYQREIRSLIEDGKYTRKLANGTDKDYYEESSKYFLEAIEKNKKLAEHFSDIEADYTLEYNLGLLQEDFYKSDAATDSFNNSLNILCKNLISKDKTIANIRENINKYNRLKAEDYLYDKNSAEYWNKSFFNRLFSEMPKKPQTYGKHEAYKKDYEASNELIRTLSELYLKIGSNSRKQGNLYNWAICEAAAKDILEMNDRADEIIKRRAAENSYIEDLYPEIE